MTEPGADVRGASDTGHGTREPDIVWCTVASSWAIGTAAIVRGVPAQRSSCPQSARFTPRRLGATYSLSLRGHPSSTKNHRSSCSSATRSASRCAPRPPAGNRFAERSSRSRTARRGPCRPKRRPSSCGPFPVDAAEFRRPRGTLRRGAGTGRRDHGVHCGLTGHGASHRPRCSSAGGRSRWRSRPVLCGAVGGRAAGYSTWPGRLPEDCSR